MRYINPTRWSHKDLHVFIKSVCVIDCRVEFLIGSHTHSLNSFKLLAIYVLFIACAKKQVTVVSAIIFLFCYLPFRQLTLWLWSFKAKKICKFFKFEVLWGNKKRAVFSIFQVCKYAIKSKYFAFKLLVCLFFLNLYWWKLLKITFIFIWAAKITNILINI